VDEPHDLGFVVIWPSEHAIENLFHRFVMMPVYRIGLFRRNVRPLSSVA
jgi:hypothetical protein